MYLNNQIKDSHSHIGYLVDHFKSMNRVENELLLIHMSILGKI
jgi:hypothetical protein